MVLLLWAGVVTCGSQVMLRVWLSGSGPLCQAVENHVLSTPPPDSQRAILTSKVEHVSPFVPGLLHMKVEPISDFRTAD